MRSAEPDRRVKSALVSPHGSWWGDDRRMVRSLIPSSTGSRGGHVAGKHCLDVGTFDGFLAFEMERRGAAEVVCTDIPSHSDWDIPPRLAWWAEKAGEKGAGFRIASEILGFERAAGMDQYLRPVTGAPGHLRRRGVRHLAAALAVAVCGPRGHRRPLPRRVPFHRADRPAPHDAVRGVGRRSLSRITRALDDSARPNAHGCCRSPASTSSASCAYGVPFS